MNEKFIKFNSKKNLLDMLSPAAITASTLNEGTLFEIILKPFWKFVVSISLIILFIRLLSSPDSSSLSSSSSSV